MDTRGWLKGNTHTHTSRSDGDAAPLQVAEWYASHGYDFLAITDHNCYFRARDVASLPPLTVRRAEGAAGAADDVLMVLTGSELSCRSDAPRKPVDVCSISGSGDDPRGREVPTVSGPPGAAARHAVAAARSAGGLPIVCHPCWHWALAADDLLTVPDPFLLEVFNASDDCNNYCAGGADSPEDLWDKLLSAGRRVWAVAADDTHRVLEPGSPPVNNPGLAWVRVGAEARSADAIVAAMAAGRFYATTGVELADLDAIPARVAVQILPVRDFKYTIHFIGVGGRVLRTVHGLSGQYSPRGDEVFVRVRIECSDGGACWTQPIFLPQN